MSTPSAADNGSSNWQQAEDWALLDCVPSFTAGDGAQTVTFWQAMSTSTPALQRFSPSELEIRYKEIGGQTAGGQPPVLDDWEKLADGRYTGRLAGQASSVWLTVAAEGKLASDPRDEPGYIEAIGGRIYELTRVGAKRQPEANVAAAPGASSSLPLLAQNPSPLTAADPWSVRLPYAGVAIITGLLVGAIGYGAGVSSVPPPPPPPPPRVTKVFLAPPSSSSSSSNRALAPSERKAEALTVGEQKERAALRLERDKARLSMLETKIKEDQQRLAEFERVEAEKGASADAVKLIFPPAS